MENFISTPDGTRYNEDQLEGLTDEVKDYQLTHGSLIKVVPFESDSSVPGRPIGASVLPTPFPKRHFNQAVQLQYAYNELYIRVASDPEWLHTVLKPLIEHDQLVATLWDIYVKVRDSGATQEYACGVFRSDYMLHQPAGSLQPELKQVEMNTFSCAGACHAERIANMHQHLTRVRGLVQGENQRLAESSNTKSIVDMLKATHDTYASTFPSERQKCVLMTVQPFNINIADERPIEYGLWNANIPCYRCDWPELLERTRLVEDRKLFYTPEISNIEVEVSVVYHRAGYDAAEYYEKGIETKLRLEMSNAIKSPDILGHLTTFKSVQQALTAPDALAKFISSQRAEEVRQTFMPMYILDSSPSGQEAQAIALNPKQAVNYVLKPNLEGGGHNIYRADMVEHLSKIPKEQYAKYTLMRLIEPPATTGTLMMPEDLYFGPVVSELGILGTCLWRRKGDGGVELLRNEVGGWTFKTKPRAIDEMSVVKGYGCFDCPLLVP